MHWRVLVGYWWDGGPWIWVWEHPETPLPAPPGLRMRIELGVAATFKD